MTQRKPLDELARDKAAIALQVLSDVMENDLAEDRDRIRAAEAVLDRGYGKPQQAIISIPANRKQAALLAGLSDEALVAIIEAKQLPSLRPKQPLITVESPAPTRRAPNGYHSHGPSDMDEEALDIDPLLR